MSSEKVSLEALEKGIKSQPLGPPKRGMSVGDFQGETLKGKNNEKTRKGPATNVADTTLVLVSRVANGGNQWYTKNPRKAL